LVALCEEIGVLELRVRYGPIEDWDVSKATDLSHLFSEYGERLDFNADISRWDVSSVTDAVNMFSGAASFNIDLNSWDVSQITGMQSMFYQASEFNQNLDGWDRVVDDWESVDTAGMFASSPLKGEDEPCWLSGRPCHSFELDIDEGRTPTAADSAVTTVYNPTASNTVYKVGTSYRFPRLNFSIREHAKGETTTAVRFDLVNAPQGFSVNTKNGVVFGSFNSRDVAK
jgi:surface protein